MGTTQPRACQTVLLSLSFVAHPSHIMSGTFCVYSSNCDPGEYCDSDNTCQYSAVDSSAGLIVGIISSIIGFQVFVGCVVGWCWWFKNAGRRRGLTNTTTIVT